MRFHCHCLNVSIDVLDISDDHQLLSRTIARARRIRDRFLFRTRAHRTATACERVSRLARVQHGIRSSSEHTLAKSASNRARQGDETAPVLEL